MKLTLTPLNAILITQALNTYKQSIENPELRADLDFALKNIHSALDRESKKLDNSRFLSAWSEAAIKLKGVI